MKRNILILVILLLTLLVGCGTEPEPVPETTVAPVLYSADLKSGTSVYLDIVAIEPAYTISMKVGNVVTDSTYELVCACVTPADEIVWLHVYKSDYVKYIDPDSNNYLNYLDLYEHDEELTYDPLKEFDEPVRIYGKMRLSESVCDGLSKELGQMEVISFVGIE